jgi:hypothetical protein
MNSMMRRGLTWSLLSLSLCGWACDSPPESANELDASHGHALPDDAGADAARSADDDRADAASGDGDGHGNGDGDGDGKDAAVPPDVTKLPPWLVDPERKPDADTTKVASCQGQPDMTLCDVVTEPDRWYDVCVGGTCVSPGCGSADCNTRSPHFHIPPREHHPMQTSDGAQPVVSDLITGMQWQGCSTPPNQRQFHGCLPGEPVDRTFADALAYCDTLSWGGFDDWYLPDAFELTSLYASELSDGTSVWTTTSHSPTTSLAFVPGLPDWRFWAQQARVVCARRGSSGPVANADARWTRPSEGSDEPILEDETTGLAWTACVYGLRGKDCDQDEAILVPQAGAHAACEDLVWGGHDDWRLPQYQEAFSMSELDNWDRDVLAWAALDSTDNPSDCIYLNDGLFCTERGKRLSNGSPEAGRALLCVRYLQ